MGSSALTWAQAIRRFSPHGGAITCVDAWAPFIAEGDLAKGGAYSEFEALCKTEIPFALFRHNTQSITGAVTLEVKRGNSAEVLKGLEKGAYDLVYIDGSHYYDAVMADLTLGAHLVRDGGIFCGDDLEAQVGQVDAAFVERSIKEDFVTDPATGASFHPGVALACHRFFGRIVPAAIGFFFLQKVGDGYRDISLAGHLPIIPDHFDAPNKASCYALLDALPKAQVSR